MQTISIRRRRRAGERGKPIAAPIAFLDLEASGLGPASWPVEVGWCFLTGRPQSMLVSPAECWPGDAWDPQAEALHGLSIRRLQREGHPPQKICAAMNEALAGAAVYSDAPDWDGFWLYRLFAVAKIRRSFDLLNFADLFERISPDDFLDAKSRAQRTAPHKHRAKPDVLHMRALYCLAGGGERPAG